ncbi:unnamed protein product [Arabidopsis arenosa]|uniref:Uncharacterized protein n=1 Tax=Arabidopsis arenosa TaxID=38785 RepID=A0A8S2B3I3_ARAAE|nr:unnamed protein product [Arabidopsis arenosa]
MGEFDKITAEFDKITALYDKMVSQYDDMIEKWRNIQAKLKQGKKTTQQATSEKETIEMKQSLEATKEDVNELTQAVVSVEKLQSESKENLSLIEEEESPPVKKTQQEVMETVTLKLPVAMVLPAASQLESKHQNSEVIAAPYVEVLEAAASELEPKQTKPLNSEVIAAPVLVVKEFVENSLDINYIYMMQATVQEIMTHQQLLHLLTRFFVSRVPQSLLPC